MIPRKIRSSIVNLPHLVWNYFCCRALQSEYSLRDSIDVQEYEKIESELEKSYKAVKVASDVESSSFLSESAFVFDTLPEQRRGPAQRPSIHIAKYYRIDMADLLAGELRSKRKPSDAESL